MKVSEFKKILKPLIRQTVKEVILDEGLLSGIVSEVAQGLQGSVITEEKEKRHIAPIRHVIFFILLFIFTYFINFGIIIFFIKHRKKELNFSGTN